MREIDKILDTNEKVSWEGGPKFWPYFLTTLVPFLFTGGIILAILVGFSSMVGWAAFLNPLTLAVILGFLGGPVYQAIHYRYLHYATTDKRVLIQKGIIGRDFESIDFDQITNVDVVVGFWDKVAGSSSGSVIVSSASSGDVNTALRGIIANIENPYEVFKHIKKVAHDVKTDMHFPNELRPAQNPGYQTTYTPGQK